MLRTKLSPRHTVPEEARHHCEARSCDLSLEGGRNSARQHAVRFGYVAVDKGDLQPLGSAAWRRSFTVAFNPLFRVSDKHQPQDFWLDDPAHRSVSCHLRSRGRLHPFRPRTDLPSADLAEWAAFSSRFSLERDLQTGAFRATKALSKAVYRARLGYGHVDPQGDQPHATGRCFRAAGTPEISIRSLCAAEGVCSRRYPVSRRMHGCRFFIEQALPGFSKTTLAIGRIIEAQECRATPPMALCSSGCHADHAGGVAGGA